MPRWGLTQEMVRAKPWGFDPDPDYGLLHPAKVITDPVHGDIYVNRLELMIINSRAFQRLRRVRQLGMAPMVYPGATNTRFSHSLGTLRAAQDLLDIVLEQRFDPHGTKPDLFGEWEAVADNEEDFERQLGEVVSSARLGGLLHDLCHVPFGHSVEDDLGILEAHDGNERRFNHLWLLLGQDLCRQARPEQIEDVERLLSGKLYSNLVPLILSKQKDEHGEEIDPHQQLEYPFVADLVGNTICADLIDYLPRDHFYAGLPVALGHRFMSAFFVTGSDRTRYSERMALSVVRAERERTDVITELLKYLRYRYELTERVIVHHAKLAADAMVGKALELCFAQLEDEARVDSEAAPAQGRSDAEAFAAATSEGEARAEPSSTAEASTEPSLTSEDPKLEADTEAETALASGASAGRDAPPKPDDSALPTLLAATDDPPSLKAKKQLERRILAHGDDGLLEYLRDWVTGHAHAGSPRLQALGSLVNGLLDRDLFRLAGRSSTQQASADSIYQAHGEAEARRELEEDAARFAGIDEPWKLAIWLPPPAPRLKSAEVLVFDGSEVVEFYRSEQYSTKRGEDIYEAHKKLWAVSVYMHRTIEAEQARKALVRLAQRMEVRFDAEVEELGRQVLLWPDILAARKVVEELNLPPRRAREMVETARAEAVARGPEEEAPTFETLLATYRQLAEQDS